jgi:GxxExxY protein
MNNQDKPKTRWDPLPAETEELAHQVVDAALTVHKTLGPGLLETVYEACLVYELRKRGMHVDQQISLPIYYDGVKLDAGLRLDIVVENQIILELKAVDNLLPVHKAQVMTYLKLTGYRLGLLINFNVPLLKHGIQRIII